MTTVPCTTDRMRLILSFSGPDDVGSEVSEISLDDMGMGGWTGQLPDGGFLSVFLGGPGSQQQTFEVGVSNTGEYLFY